MKFLLDKLLDT